VETRPVLLGFNRGLVSKLALARVDLKRLALSAETFINWMPRVLGAMRLRPGTRYRQSTRNSAASRDLPFIFSTDDTAIVELTDSAMRVVIDGLVVTRSSVSTAVTNGSFDADLTGWTDSDESGAVSSWLTGGYLSLLGTDETSAIRDQQVTVAAGDQGVEHALAIYVHRGTATLKLGTSQGGEQYRAATTLRQGYHSIAITPTGDFWIRISAETDTACLIGNITIESAGDLVLPTPWGSANLQDIRAEQSGDVLFCACVDHRQRRIERQATRSWSVVEYIPEDGPFRGQNTTATTLAPGNLTGSTSLTASQSYFKSTNVGSLFKMASRGQVVSQSVVAQDTWTDPIRVTGIDNGRAFTVVISGTWSATVTLQRSVVEPGDWTDVTTYTANTTIAIDDTLDNQIVYYRIGVKTGEFTSGTAAIQLSYASGSIEGVCIVTEYVSPTVVLIDILSPFGITTATSDWWEGLWSDRRGWPSAVALYDGRLWWAGKDAIRGSVSDAFASFDDEVEGDSGPIARSIGSGPVDTINWILPLSLLIVGTEGAELVAKSSSLDEPLTPTAFSLKAASTQGSSDVPAVRIDTSGVFVQRNGSRVYELTLDSGTYGYASNDLTSIIPEIGDSPFRRVAVQRQPDTRIHCVRADGTVAILVFDRLEKVTCWVEYETDGDVEDVVVLPGVLEDEVFYTVKRTINGSTKRYREQWALESETLGTSTTVLMDSTKEYNGVSGTTVSGLSHLEGETVAVWANSKDLGTYTVSGGEITVSEAVTTAFVGLPYTADFKSARFPEASSIPLGQRQQIHGVSLLLSDTHAQGIKFGQDFDHLDSLPQIDDEEGQVDQDSIWDTYVADAHPINGTWSNDTRLCLRAVSPRPCTVLAAIVSVTGHAK
jgi:hypothetical protein